MSCFIIRRMGLALFLVLPLLSPLHAAEAIDLAPRVEPRSLARVTIELEVGGDALVRAESTADGTPGEEQRLPISVAAKIRYDERRLAAANITAAADSARTPLALRYYDQAEAVIKVDQSGVAPKLSDAHRLIVVENAPRRPILISAGGPMQREQLDLIDVVGSSTIIHRLLPPKPTAEGGTWPQESDTMAALLALDSVAVCEVQTVLEEFNPQFAKIRLAGVVHGMADGAATEHEVRGVFLFDRRLRQVMRLNMAVRETRSIGGATPGLDAVAKFQMKLEPLTTSPHLTDAAVASLSRAGQPPVRTLVLEASELGFRAEHDRQWFVTSEQRETVTLRRVDQGDLVAQCAITSLPPKSAGRQTSLEQFQKDITFALGKNFGQVVASRQWNNEIGLHCYEVIVRGQVEGLPVEWHYYLVAPDSGHRISVAVTAEGSMVDRLGQADRMLVNAIELFTPQKPPIPTAARPASPPSTAGTR